MTKAPLPLGSDSPVFVQRFVRTLVVDQSMACTGFAVVEHDPRVELVFGITGALIAHGHIKPKGNDLTAKILDLKNDLASLAKGYEVAEIVAEDTLHITQRKAATNQAMAAALICVTEAAAVSGLPAPYLLSNNSVKKLVAGHGKADKEKVSAAVCDLWRLRPSAILDDNHSDALAIAFAWLALADEKRQKRMEKQLKTAKRKKA